MPNRASRLDNLPPYVFVVINQQLQELSTAGHDIIRMDVGSPDKPPPDHVIEALYASAKQPNKHGYAGYKGTPVFREAIAAHVQSRFGVKANSNTEVLPLIGSKEGIVNLCLAMLGEGDTVLVPTIGYPSYAMAAHLVGAEIDWVATDPDTYVMDVSSISPERAQKAKMIWVNYPNNPTGAVVDKAYYQEVVNFCLNYDILLASDNPYVDITYDGFKASSVLECDGAMDCTVEYLSFSKSYNMAGWRLGAAVGNAEMLKHLLHVKSNMDSGHFMAIYDAGIAAMQNTPQSWLDSRNAMYQARRDKIVAALPDIGLSGKSPLGAMYVWAKVNDSDDEQQYVHEMLQNAHVSMAPGAAYGPDGKGYVRMTVGITDERLDEALTRMKTYYAQR